MKCRRCGRILKTDKARLAGIGPVCAKKEQLAAQESVPAGEQFLEAAFDGVVLLERQDGAIATNVPHVWNLHGRGFAWGYGGSGAADLALNILLRFGLSEKHAERLHQDFKWRFIAPMPKEGGTISGEVIRSWIAQATAPMAQVS